MKYKLILSLLFIFLIGNVSASFLGWGDNYRALPNYQNGIQLGERQLDYNSIWDTYQPIQLSTSSFFGLRTTPILDGAIVQHTESCGYDCSSTIDLTTYQESSLVDNINFYDKNGDETSIDNYNLYIQNGENTIQIPDYEYQCNGYSINGSQSCQDVQIGTHEEIQPIWQPYSIGDVVPSGDYVLKITGQKDWKKEVDWIITTQGQSLDSWAKWGVVNSMANYTLDDVSNFGKDTGIGNSTGSLMGVILLSHQLY